MSSDWWADASCATLDADAFYPEVGAHADTTAKRVCTRCPVQAECLTWALDHGEEHGIWGGLSYNERLRLSDECWACGWIGRTHAKGLCSGCYKRWKKHGFEGMGPGPKEHPPMLDSAEEYLATITSLSASRAGEQLGVTARTIQRWRAALREAS